ncbi:MAG: hypothetical protein KY475_09800 [Planctomycetes bacterium]|nr:hypothetical protein [Planctomycetota bacterium]
MNERFLVIGSDGSYGGAWGSGATQDEATDNDFRAAGAGNAKVYRFTSDLPFAPADRDATDDEADAWVDEYGGTSWVRCDREEVLD